MRTLVLALFSFVLVASCGSDSKKPAASDGGTDAKVTLTDSQPTEVGSSLEVQPGSDSTLQTDVPASGDVPTSTDGQPVGEAGASADGTTTSTSVTTSTVAQTVTTTSTSTGLAADAGGGDSVASQPDVAAVD